MFTNKCILLAIISVVLFENVVTLPSGKLAALRSERNSHGKKKYNIKYQECEAPGNQKGHCKHFRFCPTPILQISNPRFLDSLCVIDNTFVGICCPNYLSKSMIASAGSNILEDLPSGGLDYEDEEVQDKTNLRCGSSGNSGWPWAAMLIEIGRIPFCGGVLITDKHVLTAAHCFDIVKAKNIIVRLGEYDYTIHNETRSQDFLVLNIDIHPDYDRATYNNDIALLRLNKATTFNSYVWPICLPPLDDDFVNKTAVAVGWGAKMLNGPMQNILNEVRFPIWDSESCVQALTQTISENSFCAGAKEGVGDTCQGDSGGPLMVQLENGRWVVVGLVSYGYNCGVMGRPGIYTKVSSYLRFIFEKVFS